MLRAQLHSEIEIAWTKWAPAEKLRCKFKRPRINKRILFQCNLYVNGASFNGLTSGLLVFSTALSLYINYFRNANW